MTTPPGQQPPYGDSGEPRYGQQPQYGQYGQPYSAGSAYGDPVETGAKFGVAGATLAGIGAILLIISFTAVDWLKFGGTSFSDLHDAASSPGAPAMSSVYFGWLAWTLAIVLVVVAIVASLPSPASSPLRALGGVLGAAGIVFTIFGLKGDQSFGDTFSNARGGFYLALAGFLLAGIGALMGPSHRR